jgi:hypothetical protein
MPTTTIDQPTINHLKKSDTEPHSFSEYWNRGILVMQLLIARKMEPHGQSPWFPRNAHKGRTSRTRGPIHPRVEPVVLLVRDRISPSLHHSSIPLFHGSMIILRGPGDCISSSGLENLAEAFRPLPLPS